MHAMDADITPEKHNHRVPILRSFGIEKASPKGTTIHWIPDVDESIKPRLFTRFKSIDAAYESYKEYGKRGGFEVRKATQEKNRHEVSHKWIVCSREGFLTEKKKQGTQASSENGDGNKKQKRNRPSSRCGCEAKICIRLTRNKQYELYVFEEKHNHSLVHPDDRHYLKSLRKLNYSDKTLLVKMSNRNIGPVVAYNILSEIHGGFDKVGALPQDAKNFKRDILACIGDSDANMIVKMLTKKSECVSDFSFKYRLADEKHLIGLFWADEQAKRNYYAFGDIISFDATYRTNKYSMRFVPFTGIDNHHRSVNFGAALLHTEATDSFKWMLEMFKEVFLREPKVVVTDQDPAMKVAIEAVFTNARHRFCMWHIMEKLTSKVGTSISRSGFKKKISKIIWTDRLDPNDFDDKWSSIVNEFHLEDNKWLSDMFKLRGKWIPVYFRDMPLSGLMRTTSRSESENHMFGRLLNPNLTFVEFFSHFETAVQTQRFRQGKNDHDTRYTTPKTETTLPFEAEAILIYTRKLFVDVVQKEMLAAVHACYCIGVVSIDESREYTILDTDVRVKIFDDNGDEIIGGHDTIEVKYQVEYKESDGTLLCTCQYFERCGLLCRHIFYVLRILKVNSFPKRYIQRRWTRDCVPIKSSEASTIRHGLGEIQEQSGALIRDIYYTVDATINRLLSNNAKLAAYRMVQKELLEKADAEMENQPVTGNKEFIHALLDLPEIEEDDDTILNPIPIDPKGCGRKRLKNAYEEASTKKQKQTRACTKCGENGHNSCTCEKKSSTSKEKAPISEE